MSSRAHVSRSSLFGLPGVFRTDVGALKRVGAAIGTSYMSSAIGFAATILLARALGSSDYAWVSFGLAVGAFLIPLIDLGSERTFARAARLQDGGDVARLARANFRRRGAVALAAAVLVVIGASVHAHDAADAAAIILLSMWCGLQGLFPGAWYDYYHATRLQNQIVFFERLAILACVCALFLVPPGLRQAVLVGAALLCVRLGFLALQIRLWRKRFPEAGVGVQAPAPAADIGDGTDWRVAAALLMNACLAYGNQLVLGTTRAPSELAAYGLSMQLMGLVFLFQSQMARIRGRGINEACVSRGALVRSIVRSGAVLVAGSVVLAGGTWLAAHLLVSHLDAGFAAMPEICSILAVWVVVLGFGLVVSQHNIALGQQSFYMKTAAVGGVTALALGYALVPDYGAIAVAAILLAVHGLVVIAGLVRLIVSVVGWKERA